MTHGNNRRLEVGALARVEGDGGLRVVVQDGTVSDVVLDIYEPPRFFEAFLVGRHYREVPDITARICGICPVAYQMSSCAAIEDALGVTVTPQVQLLRRLLYCGEWLQSHALHVHFLHAPDFFGCEDVTDLAAIDRRAVERGIALKKTGNRLMELVGGRAVHPVNVRVGGFYRAPSRGQLEQLREPLREALGMALETVTWATGFDFPDVERDYVFVALAGEAQYPLDTGHVSSSSGTSWAPSDFADVAVEEQVAHSTALHARLYGRDPYLTGPLARYALNHAALTPVARQAAVAAGLGEVCRNPFRSILVRSVEMVYVCEEALRLIDGYEPPAPPAIDVPLPAAGTALAGTALAGTGATEAPRGLLLHRYEIGPDGLITKARIMPPTSQNQLAIEQDLRAVAEKGLALSDEDLTRRAEMAVRNHDPCISCAAHFLDLSVEHRP